jgi:hypothetical protein
MYDNWRIHRMEADYRQLNLVNEHNILNEPLHYYNHLILSLGKYLYPDGEASTQSIDQEYQ